MLNKLLERLPLLLSEGIDYKATKDAMQKAQEESRHLWQFVRDVGIEVQAGGRIYIKDLWELLQKWYLETGTLEIEEGSNGKDKLIWHDLPNKYDTPVKAVNQVFARFSEIFPKLKKLQYNGRDEMERRAQWYLSGIGFVKNVDTSANFALPALPVDTEGLTALPTALPQNSGRPSGRAETLAHQAGRDGRAISSPFAEVCKLVAQFTDEERQKLADILTQPQLLPKKVTPEDAQKMRDIARVWWLEYYPERIQALVTQMYGWQAPGTKYDVATLAEWLEGEDSLIRDRITELMHRRRG
jgi:putative DNA primase/helicase